MKTLTKTTLILSSALALAACGGGGGHESGTSVGTAGSSGSQSLVYSYPDNGQTEVAARSPVVLRFTSEVSSANGITLHEGDASGPLVATKPAEFAPDHKGVILTPTDPLKAHQSYTVVVHNIGTISNKTISFETRALQEGPKSLVVEDSDFKVKRRFPDGTTNEPVMDFSTFRLQFSQPIDASTAHYGADPTDSIKLVDQNGNLVDATLIVDGPYMTIDPKKDYLNPGQHYTLTLGTGLASTYGETLAQADDIKFTPKDSTPNGGPPAMLVQRITDSQNGNVLSPLSGAPVNEVAVKGTLLGENGANSTQANAVVHAELADLTTYTNVLPIRIPKGTVLTGSSIDIKIGGKVDAGYDSGDVTMTLLSDATGTMVLNPYSTQADAPRIVHLFMDVGITTEDPRANGGFTQNLLHIELVGTSKVDTKAGVLDLDAISVVQPNVLGQEYGYAVLSFQLKSDRDQTQAPPFEEDKTPPKVQSWTFGTDQETGLDKTVMLQPTDPLIINFDKPLDPQSIIGRVHLYKEEGGTQTELAVKVHVDGAAIVIKPQDPLEHPMESDPQFTYQVVLDSGITDVTGNEWLETFSKTLALNTLADKRDLYKRNAGLSMFSPDPWLSAGTNQPLDKHSPYLLAVYPGFPCALSTTDQNLAQNIAGRCMGGVQPESVDPSNLSNLTPDEMAEVPPYDDLLPVPEMPANRPIIVVFSKAMDPTSIKLGQTFEVYEVDAQGQVLAPVDGSVSLKGDTLRFTPAAPWKKDVLYRYVLKSNGDINNSLCDPSTMVCGKDGLPLQTQLMANISFHDIAQGVFPNNGARYTPYLVWEEKSPSLTGGGPDLVQYFRGTARTRSVLQLLRLSDTIDANANLENDSTAQIMGPPPTYIKRANGQEVMGGSDSFLVATFPEYAINETDQVTWSPDPTTADLMDRNGVPMDPDGVEPPPNSAKILSHDMGDRSMAEVAEKGYDTDGHDGPNPGLTISAPDAMVGMVIGCGYESFEPYPDQTGCEEGGQQESYIPPGGFIPVSEGTCYQAKPAVCPQDKFTYLTGALFAEVTNQTTADGDIKVRIYPGHMVTTSFRSYTKGPFSNAAVENIADSGYQLMRMRYVDRQPIEGVIENGPDGPQLGTPVINLYMDAPFLASDLTIRKNLVNYVNHNLYSYPVRMKLSGPLSFLSDGRMLVDQWNADALTIHLRMNIPALSVDLVVPAQGTHIRYVSEPIK